MGFFDKRLRHGAQLKKTVSEKKLYYECDVYYLVTWEIGQKTHSALEQSGGEAAIVPASFPLNEMDEAITRCY